jgi:uncharacterized membrane protein
MAINQYPSGSDYVEALQNPGVCFKDKELKNFRVRLDKLGRPRPISGNFASVFALTTQQEDRKYAIKCFTRNVPDQELRYLAVSDHLATIEARWKVGFDYKPDAILIRGQWYPLLQMEWVEGTNLISWIDKHLNDPNSIFELANNFVTLVSSLETHDIAHGDLQHGNLLVADDSSLRLVDYDGMFVPALANLPAAEQGHRNYQAPTRSNEFHSTIDRFSAWVIYLSLVAIATQSDLWMKLRSPDGEYLLLAEDDFKNPAGSSRFASLLNHSSAPIRELTEQLLGFTHLPTGALPQLAPVEFEIATFTYPKPSAAAPNKPAVSRAGGPPPWILTHLHPTSSSALVRFSARPLSTLLLSLAMPVLVSIFSVVTPIGLLSAALAAGLGIVLFLIWLGVMYTAYRRRPEARARRNCLSRWADVRGQEKQVRREAKNVEKKIENFESSEVRRADKLRQERENIHKRHKDQADQADRELQRRLNQLAEESAALTRRRQSELDRALRDVQQAHILAHLRTASLATAKLPGFGPKMISNLRDFGISSAADFSGIRYIASGQRSVPFVVHKSGQQFKIPNLGEVKARTLESWRYSQLERAMLSMPTVLPEHLRVAIFGRYFGDERRIKNAQEDVERATRDKKGLISRNLSAALVQLSESQKEDNIAAAQTRRELNLARAASHSRLEGLKPYMTRAEQELSLYRDISFRRFVVFACTG